MQKKTDEPRGRKKKSVPGGTTTHSFDKHSRCLNRNSITLQQVPEFRSHGYYKNVSMKQSDYNQNVFSYF